MKNLVNKMSLVTLLLALGLGAAHATTTVAPVTPKQTASQPSQVKKTPHKPAIKKVAKTKKVEKKA